jgi:uncharacterized membrane protein
MKINLIIPLSLMISVALISGILFSFTIAVSPGLKHQSDLEFLKAMKSINKEILNPPFLFCFFSPLLLFPLTIYLQENTGSNRWLLSAGFLSYILVIGITATINVPLNYQLERLDLLNTSQLELLEFRNVFENPWAYWNKIRTVLSVISIILLTLWQLKSGK